MGFVLSRVGVDPSCRRYGVSSSRSRRESRMGRMSKEARCIGVRWSATWRIKGRPITDLTSDDPAVYTEPVACCLIQLTPRHTNTRLNTRVALYAYADAYCTCGAVVGRTEHDRWMPRQIGEPRCPREGEALSRGWIESRIPDDWIRRNGFEEGKNCSKVIEIPSPNSTQRSIVRRFNSDIALLS